MVIYKFIILNFANIKLFVITTFEKVYENFIEIFYLKIWFIY